MNTAVLLKMCRCCRGNAYKTLGMYRCKVCKMSLQDYEKQGHRLEVDELDYLHTTWQKCAKFKQISTGFKKMDQLLTQLFGVPHTDRNATGQLTWRNYDLLPPGKVVMDDCVVLRTVDDSVLLCNKTLQVA